ncbi:MAG: diguanylate cyclase [Rhizobacter sp.]
MKLNLTLGRKKVASPGFNRSAEKSRVAESLVRSASRLLERRNDQDVIQSVCESLTAATPHVRLAWTWFGPVDTPRIVPQVVVGPAADYARKLSIDRSFFTEIGPAFRTLAGKKVEPFNVSRMSLYGPWREAAAIHGIRCSLALPLASSVNNDRGLLALYADQPDYFEQVGIDLFEALADMFSSLLSAATERVQLREASFSDALTGLLNRHAVDVVARPMLRIDALDPQATVLVIDIDHFKRVNDDCGHAGGDALLCSVADRLRRALRKADNVLRWGGEVFLVCLPRTDIASATLVAYKILDAVGQHPHALPDGRSMQLTVSIGVAELGIAEPFLAGVERAGTALCEAKSRGRNRVCKAHAMAESDSATQVDRRDTIERPLTRDFTRTRASLP